MGIKELESIIQQAVNGNNDCRKIIYDHYAPKLLAVCKRYMGSINNAEDVFQESMVLIFLNLHQFDPAKGELGAWMYRITINEAIKQIKKINSNKNQPIDIADIDALQHQPIDSECTLTELKSYIDSLPMNQKTVFNLAVIEGYNHNEIAELLNIGESTSRSQLTRAKKSLRQIIAQNEGEIAFTP